MLREKRWRQGHSRTNDNMQMNARFLCTQSFSKLYVTQEIRRKEQEAEEEEKRTPHLSNLNEDPALCGKLLHMIRKGKSLLGNNKDASQQPEIILNGPRFSSIIIKCCSTG